MLQSLQEQLETGIDPAHGTPASLSQSFSKVCWKPSNATGDNLMVDCNERSGDSG